MTSAPSAVTATDPMTPRLATVTRVVRESADVVTLEIEPPRPERRFHFSPGQFNMVYVFGVGEVPLSLSGDPAEHGAMVHTIRAVGVVTDRLKKVKRGDVLGIRGPFGNGWPLESARGRDLVIVAGGVGLAPLRPVIYHVLSHRLDFARVLVLYGARRPEDMIFVRDLASWRGRFDVGVKVIVERAEEEWRGHVGFVTHLLRRAYIDGEETVAFICGPEVLLRFAARDLMDRGVPKEQIFVSLERNMKCAVGHCGHCQLGPFFLCKDGPVVGFDRVGSYLQLREI